MRIQILILVFKGAELTCPMGKCLGKSSSNWNISYDKQVVALGKQNMTQSCFPKGQPGIQVFFFECWWPPLIYFQVKPETG